MTFSIEPTGAGIEGMQWLPVAKVDKYADDQVEYVRANTGLRQPEGAALARFCKPYDSVEVVGMPFTIWGLDRFSAVLIGGPTGTLDSTRIRLGIGSDITDYDPGVFDSGIASDSCFRIMDTTYPHQSNGVSMFKSTFGQTDGNFEWNHWSLDVSTANMSAAQTAVLFHREMGLGLKKSGTWVLTVTFSWILDAAPSYVRLQQG